jgi:hypothetical protein
MKTWLQKLKYDAISPLLKSSNPAITYFIHRDIQQQNVPPIPTLWKLPQVEQHFIQQQSNGSWTFQGKKRELYPPHHYPLVETWKQLRILIEQYALTNKHNRIQRGCEYLFTCQTKEGDIRGMIGNQYAPYYTGAMLGILIKAGYQNDNRVINGLEWLLTMRQDDGGWSIPLITHSFNRETQYRLTSTNTKPIKPDRSKPFSHNWTDMVLRGFAPHPTYRKKPEIIHAATLLKSRFFKKDVYSSYQASRYWTRFTFWWPNLLISLEILHQCGFTTNDIKIKTALNWFIDNQQKDGLWYLVYPPPEKISNKRLCRERQEWLALRIMRMLYSYQFCKK